MHAELQLDNQICFRLYTAARLITQAYAPMLNELGITYPQGGRSLQAHPCRHG